MLLDHLLRTDFRCLCKRDLLRKPGGMYHARLSFLHMPYSAIHHIADTVDQPYFYLILSHERYFHRLTRDKLRFCCGNGLSRAALRQFIHRLFFAVFILHMRQDTQIHKSFDKG